MTTTATNKQVPDHSIMDKFNKQNYLGNQFCFPVNGISLPNTTETAIILMMNTKISSSNFINQKSLFYSLRSYISTAQAVQFKIYLNPTVTAAGVQKVIFTADVGGSLNSTYFLLYDQQGNGYYVWFNINSAGVDPALPGKIGIQVSGATGETASALGGFAATAIQAINSGLSFTAGNASGTVTITMVNSGTFTPAIDSVSAPTHFTFSVTGGLGNTSIPICTRPGNPNTSVASFYKTGNFGVSANGTLASMVGCPAAYASPLNQDQTMFILDPSNSILITATALTSTTTIGIDSSWFEI